MKTQEFEQELKAINSDLSIRYNKAHPVIPNITDIASITLQGVDVIAIPSDEIYDQRNENYGVDIAGNGNFVSHRTRPEALEIVKAKLKQLSEDKDYADAFFGRGDYSNNALKQDEEKQGDVMIVDTVEGQLGEVKSESTFIPNAKN